MAVRAEYLDAAVRTASFEKMEDDSWFASIPNFDGLWATGPTLEEARNDLLEALPDWIEAHTGAGNRAPDVDGVSAGTSS
jgi:predicted RNase H-like HicB family nuclease